MTEQQLRALAPALVRFLDPLLFCCAYTQTFGHLGTYVRGLLSDLPRKSVEPIALQAGTPVRTLQEFLKDHAWDAHRVRQHLQRHTASLLPTLPSDALGTVGLIDATSTRKRPGFVAGLDERQLRFVGEVPRSCSCWAAVKSGRRPEQGKGRPAEEVVRHASAFRRQSWQVLRLARRSLEDQVWRVKAARVWLSSGAGWSAGTYGLLWASNDATGEEKVFLSNAPAESGVGVLVRVAFRRACVEHSFRVSKSELGFSHFEGRN